jgi:hypothetical protein
MDCRLILWNAHNSTILQYIHLFGSFSSSLSLSLSIDSRTHDCFFCSELAKETQIINPPFIHCVDIHEQGEFCAVACGDGVVRLVSLPSSNPSTHHKMNLLDEVIAHQTTASQVYDSNQLELEFV